MGLFDAIGLFGFGDKKLKQEAPKEKKPPKEKKQPELSAKDKATQAGEPYVNVISMELDPNNIHEGAFELDWNSMFITQLVKAGYMKKKDDTDQDIVDRWFQDICRTIVLEQYEQSIADPDMRNIRSKDIGGGRSEIS